jgi:hypothetical protein
MQVIVVSVFILIGWLEVVEGSNLAGLNLERGAIGEAFGDLLALLQIIHEIHKSGPCFGVVSILRSCFNSPFQGVLFKVGE